MRVVHISTLHPALDVRIFHKECRTLAAAGHELHLVVRDPPCTELDGVHFHGLPPAMGRRPLRIWSRLRNTYRCAAALRADVYHFHDAELVPVARKLRRDGARVVYDVHEDSPLEVLSLNRGTYAWAKHMAFRMLWRSARRFVDAFVCATPAIARLFPADRTITVHNYPLRREFVHSTAGGADRGDMRIIAYVGIISAIRGAREMVRAMELLPESLNARLMLIGECHPPDFESALRSLPGWGRVEFIHWLPREKLFAQVAKACCGLVMFQPGPNHLEALPNKIFEYMAAGLPIIASDFPLWRSLIEQVRCGVVANPVDAGAISRAIQFVLENPDKADQMSIHGREAVMATFNWEAEGKKLVQLYAGLAARLGITSATSKANWNQPAT